MKNVGYTLSEVLITLGIIGVIVAMTIPAIVNKVYINKNMSTLSKSVSDLENAFTSAIITEGTPDVFSLSFWPNGAAGGLTIKSSKEMKNGFNGNFSRYLKYSVTNNTVQDIYGGNNFYALDNAGKKGNKWNDCNNQGVCRFRYNYPIKMPNGAIVFLQLVSQGANGGRALIQSNDGNYITEGEAMKRGTSLRCEAGFAFIDVNGGDAPNTLGRDIFVFVIGQNGHLYPYGGKEYANFEGKANNTPSWSANAGSYYCTNTKKASSGMGCTGRVVEQGYKMTY